MRHPKHFVWLAAAATAMLASGCHLVLGPEDGEQEWWYYCDAYRCYRCNADFCEVDSDPRCPGEDPCPTPTDPPPGQCTVSADCADGFICDAGQCLPGPSSCTSDESCGDGAYCSNGSCVDSDVCKTDADCARLGSGFVCDPRGSCVPGEPPVQSCSTGASCADGLCVDGQCGSCSGDCGGGQTCQFDAHCGDGRVCLNGQCTGACAGDADCGTGQTCQGTVCAAGPTDGCSADADCSGGVCVNQVCHEDCTSSGQCTDAADTCSPAITVGARTVKVCIPDHAAQLECRINKDCTGGELCVNGVCRTSCVADEDCAACEDGPVCGPGGFCMTAAEASPACLFDTDCDSGQVCLDATCTTL